MSGTLYAGRIGPDPSEVRAIHEARQANLADDKRRDDPSSLASAALRAKQRDDLARARRDYED